MTDWQNNDGLKVRFGLSKSAVVSSGELEVDGDLREVVIHIADATLIPATASSTPITTEVGIPDNAYIDSVTVYPSVAFTSGGAATLDVGLWNDDGDGTYSTNDDNGLVAAAAIADLQANDKTAGAGAQVLTRVQGTGNRPLYVSYGYGTAVYTAGTADIVIRYRA